MVVEPHLLVSYLILKLLYTFPKIKKGILTYRIQHSAHYEYISSEKCASTITIASTGLAETHHSWLKLIGKYIEEGTSNGHISYKNAEGWYLHFSSGKWLVSKK